MAISLQFMKQENKMSMSITYNMKIEIPYNTDQIVGHMMTVEIKHTPLFFYILLTAQNLHGRSSQIGRQNETRSDLVGLHSRLCIFF